jgi:hypothetical protein
MYIFFLNTMYSSSKFFPTILETVSLCLLNYKLRNLTSGNADFKYHNWSSARCTSAANAISGDTQWKVCYY